ncbi:MAG: SUMF1/EgtB/PvdO family nonheme iron enzyme, partial [Ignavibacteriae bacterium]|nr:SUMF1/EgtB/PvdO family nonheme iron enzyme [Ignavibacteriota bacterium]
IITNGVSVDFIHDKMKNAGSSFNIVVLDACRNQPLPFKCENARSGPNRPNMVEFRPNGSLIAFSTSPGNTALDKKNGEKNSPYALALANAINTPNLKIEDVFKKVSREMEQSGQRPWSNNAFTGDFYFNKIIDNLNINDADSDGVIDRFDKCPNDPGPLTNEGCPNSLKIEEDTEVSSPSKSALLELLIPIESGQFTYGCTGNYCEKNELPDQVIKMAKFSISRYEVTNEQFANFLNEYQSNIVKEGKYKSKLMIDPKNSGGLALVKGKWIVRKGFENRAVINVTWFGAKTFCDFYGFDLPTEAQWEYASKDGRKDSKNRFAGVDFPTKLKDYAVYADNSSNEIAKVGAKFPTMLNIHDLSGNVKEWCLDWYSGKPQVFSENFEPEQNLKSIRGGSFFSVENDCRVTRRFFMTPERFDNEVGFRIVKNY